MDTQLLMLIALSVGTVYGYNSIETKELDCLQSSHWWDKIKLSTIWYYPTMNSVHFFVEGFSLNFEIVLNNTNNWINKKNHVTTLLLILILRWLERITETHCWKNNDLPLLIARNYVDRWSFLHQWHFWSYFGFM